MSLTLEEKTNALKKVPYFSELNDNESRALAEKLTECSYEKNDIIFKGGTDGHNLYILIEGRVKLTYFQDDFKSGTGEKVILDILKKGNFFGELSLIDYKPRCAQAEAVNKVLFLKLRRHHFRRHIVKNPKFTFHVLTALAETIRRLDKQISDICSGLDTKQLLARKLVDLADRFGTEDEKGDSPIVIDIGLNNIELGRMIGRKRKSVGSAMKFFCEKKWISKSPLAVLNREALSEYAKSPIQDNRCV